MELNLFLGKIKMRKRCFFSKKTISLQDVKLGFELFFQKNAIKLTIIKFFNQ